MLCITMINLSFLKQLTIYKILYDLLIFLQVFNQLLLIEKQFDSYQHLTVRKAIIFIGKLIVSITIYGEHRLFLNNILYQKQMFVCRTIIY